MWNPFKAWRDSRRQARFTKAFKQTLVAEREKLDPSEYAKCRAACEDKTKMKNLLGQMTTEPGLKGGIQDWDWEAILEWVQTYLLPLIKTLLPLLILLDERE